MGTKTTHTQNPSPHTHTHTHTQCVLVTTLYVLPLYGQHIEWAYAAVENGNGIFAAAMLAIKIKLIGTVVVEKDLAILYWLIKFLCILRLFIGIGGIFLSVGSTLSSLSTLE